MTVVRARGPRASALVTDGADGQGRSAVAAVRLLAHAGYRVTVAASGPPNQNLAASSRHCDDVVTAPAASDKDYATAVGEFVQSGRWGWVVPASDAAVLALRPSLGRVVDKAEWTLLADAAGFDVPPTIVVRSVSDLRGMAELAFPLVVKPAVGGFPARRVLSRDELAGLELPGALLAQPYLSTPLRAVGAVVSQGRVLAAVHQRYLRTWPADCGTSCLAVTVPPNLETEAALVALLGSYDGIVQIQLAGDALLDVNARVYGSLPLAHGAGLNLLAIALAAEEGQRPRVTQRARVGVVYRWLEGDLRNLLSARGRGATFTDVARGLVPYRGAVHSVWDRRDPAPALTRLRVAYSRSRPDGAPGDDRG